jgi:hypothetical protein
MAIDAEITRLMTNWARWKLGGAAIGVAMSGAYDLEAPGRREAVSMPLLNGEAADVERAVMDLPGELFHVVEQFWLKRGSIQHKAKRCGCAIATLYRRLDDAHERIQLYLKALRQRSQHARTRALDRHAEAPRCVSCGARHWLRDACNPVVKPI